MSEAESPDDICTYCGEPRSDHEPGYFNVDERVSFLDGTKNLDRATQNDGTKRPERTTQDDGTIPASESFVWTDSKYETESCG